jgi:hypothetical protein
VTRLEVTSLPAQRRRRARQWEWAEQTALAEQLADLLPPGVFWSSVDNQPWSKVAGLLRKRRGVRAGMPDLLILFEGRLIGLEMKSLIGRLSSAQEEVRLQILRAGGMWFLVRTARAALVALHGVGIRFRRPWKTPVLEPWEQPGTLKCCASGARTRSGDGRGSVSAPARPRSWRQRVTMPRAMTVRR